MRSSRPTWPHPDRPRRYLRRPVRTVVDGQVRAGEQNAAPRRQNAGMDRDRFWEIVEAARLRADNADEVPAALVELLRGRPLAELVAFREIREPAVAADERY